MAENKDKKPLGEVLINSQLITAAQLEEALEKQRESRKPLGETLVDLQYLSEKQLSTALTDQGQNRPAGAAPAGGPWILRPRVPIKIKLAAIIILIILGLILPVSVLILNKQSDQAVKRLMAFGTTLVNTYANYSAEFVLQEDWPSLDPFIREIGKLDEVRYVMILNREEIIKAHSDVSQMERCYQKPGNAFTSINKDGMSVTRFREASGDYVFDFSKPITYQDNSIGTIHLAISERSMAKDARELRFFIIVLTVFSVVVGLLIAYGAGALISRPVSSIVRGTREIGSGHLDYRISPMMNDELGDLALSFNDMADGLKKKELIQATFGRYVTPEVVDMILRNPGQVWLKGSRKMVTVMFADIRGFTAFAEDREPEEVVTVLNQFFTMSTELILSENGYVNKFVGDQVMAVFGAPIYHDDHVIKAVRTGVRIQEALAGWNRIRVSEGKPPLMAGIGINTGLVVAGNLGSEQKMEYTVIGDDVNLASRLTSLAGPGEIIISERTGEQVNKSFRLEPLAPIKVKGKKHEVMIFKVAVGGEDRA